MKTNLQKLRKAAGFKSAKAFAEHVGMNLSTYTQIEQGAIGMSIERAWEFADILGCTLDELAGRQWPPASQASMADPGQEQITRAYDQLNDSGRTKLLGAAELYLSDPANTGEGSGDPVPRTAG